MAEVVTMPRLSDTMTEGVVAKWHKKVGDKVQEGDLLAEIETDKATMEFESFQEGILLYIGIEEGASAPVDSILAILGKKDEKIEDIILKKSTASDVHISSNNDEIKSIEPVVESTQHHTEVVLADSTDRLKASPLAKKMAEAKGLDLKSILGSGDGGRIVKRDVENAKPKEELPKNTERLSTPVYGSEGFIEESVSQMRKTIARRLAESKFSAPHFYLTIDIDMDKVWNERKAINESTGQKVSFNDFVIRAAAAALRRNPKVNSSWLGDKIRYNEHIHIGVAVAVDDGLLVPVVKFADQKGLVQISEEVRIFAQKAKDKKLQPADWEGNTFTISNLGMFGIEAFTAIINPPDACILAVGSIRDEAVVKNEVVQAGKRMKVTLSCDHRVVDGATGSAFLQDFKANLENPLRMLL